MENLRYYFDVNNNLVLAYEKSTEFFVVFNSTENKWIDCNVSFAQFRHDYEFSEISQEEASSRTNGVLPKLEYKQYLDMIKSNM